MSSVVSCKYARPFPTLTKDDSVNGKDSVEAHVYICARHCPDCFYTHLSSFVSRDNEVGTSYVLNIPSHIPRVRS